MGPTPLRINQPDPCNSRKSPGRCLHDVRCHLHLGDRADIGCGPR